MDVHLQGELPLFISLLDAEADVKRFRALGRILHSEVQSFRLFCIRDDSMVGRARRARRTALVRQRLQHVKHLERRASRDVRIVAGILLEESVYAGVAGHRHGAHPVPFTDLFGRVELQSFAGLESVDEDVHVHHAVRGHVDFVQPLRRRDFRIGVQPSERIRQRRVEGGYRPRQHDAGCTNELFDVVE